MNDVDSQEGDGARMTGTADVWHPDDTAKALACG